MHREIFLFAIAIATLTYVAASNNETLPKPHVVIVGSTGVGKSSLACALIGGDPEEDGGCLFEICNGLDSCTKHTTYANGSWIGDASKPLFTIVDTPGFEDSNGEMDILIEEMVDVLNNNISSADVVLLTISAETARFTDGLIDMLKQLEMLFGRRMWNSTLVEISKFSYAQDEIDDREKDCPGSKCRDEAYWYDQINYQLEKNFKLGMNLSLVFIDSFARTNESLSDEVQQEHFLAETDKLWDFAINSPEFGFKTIDEVLEDNSLMRDEIICLNGKIDNELKALSDRIDNETRTRKHEDVNLIGSVESLEKELRGNVSEIYETIKESAESLEKELRGNVLDIYVEMRSNDNKLRDEMSKLHLSPIGSIVAWVQKANKEARNITTIPTGWIECDGRRIPTNSPSIWAGFKTPKLNEEAKLFLRGGSISEQLNMQEDLLKDHKHIDNNHTHTPKITKDYKALPYGDWYTKVISSHDAKLGRGGSNHDASVVDENQGDRKDPYIDYARTIDSETLKAKLDFSVSLGKVGSSITWVDHDSCDSRTGDETRPKNMAVTWIMRIF